MPDTTEAMTVRQFCERYGMCRESFYREVRAGGLIARKCGSKTVVLRADAEAWAANLPPLKLSA